MFNDSRSMSWKLPCCAALLLWGGLGMSSSTWAGVTVRAEGDVVRVEIDGRLFTTYHYRNTSRPFLYPVLGPGGLPMTRNWPMQDVPGEDHDHKHHKSLWYAHGSVNGVDLWSEAPNAGRTVHVKFLKLKSGPQRGVIQTLNRLESKDGNVLATDIRTMSFHAKGETKFIDFEVTIRADHGEVVFGDTKEGTMAMRLAESMRLKPNSFNRGKPTGHIVNSEGVRDGATWGKRARWVDYYGPVEGRIVGVAMFDHPSNPRHPTWWHVRDYGLFAANPFGVHYFERKPPGTGDYRIPAGESRTWRYRIYLHPGDTEAAAVAQQYQDWIGQNH